MKELILRYGRAIRGLPSVMRGYFNRFGEPGCSAIAALAVTGIISATTLQINDADSFLSFLEFNLFPIMHPFPHPLSILCLDNARVHDKIRIYALAQQFSIIVLFLPTYSFDYDPIELCFKLSKGYIRTHYGEDRAENPISQQLLAALFNCVDSDISCNLFRHCFIDVTDEDRMWANDIDRSYDIIV